VSVIVNPGHSSTESFRKIFLFQTSADMAKIETGLFSNVHKLNGRGKLVSRQGKQGAQEHQRWKNDAAGHECKRKTRCQLLVRDCGAQTARRANPRKAPGDALGDWRSFGDLYAECRFIVLHSWYQNGVNSNSPGACSVVEAIQQGIIPRQFE